MRSAILHAAPMTAPSQAAFRRALGHFATGVTVVTVEREPGRVHGMTANSFTSVSLKPPLVLVCVDHAAQTHTLIPERGRFGVNVLGEEQEALAEFFSKPEQSREDAERLNVRFRVTEQGTPVLEGSLMQLECRLFAAHRAGDHTIFVGEVEEIFSVAGRPLLFYRGRYGKLPEGNF
ncbi:MAG: flavin reductase family protein [Candidatus Acidiferrales bacterium]